MRHAEQATMQRRDAPLSDRGERQAERLAERLAALPLTAVVSSHLRRARRTAEVVAGRAGLEAEVEEGLEEVRLGEEARWRRYRGLLEPDPDDYVTAALNAVRVLSRARWTGEDGEESLESLLERGLAAIDRVTERHQGGVIACVSHGGFINAVLGSWTGAQRHMWFVPWHTGISSVLIRGDERVLLGLNDATHLGRDQDMLHILAADVVSRRSEGRGR
ncbi:MAG TPA: histidine phosphatase family protein [Candidatus Dormibacteraeota bacterium]